MIGVFLEGLDVAGRQAAILAQLGDSKGRRALDLIEIWRAIGGNATLGAALVKARPKLVPRLLVELTQDELASLAQSADAIPPHMAGVTPQARAASYAALLLNGFENRYPIAYFAHQLSLSPHAETKRLGSRLKTSLKMQPPRAGAADPVITQGWDQELVDLASLYFKARSTRHARIVNH